MRPVQNELPIKMPEPIRTAGMIRRGSVWILFAAFFAIQAVQSQPQPPGTSDLNLHRWGSITVFNGLPSDSVRAITQTSDGNIWFGTDQGLARFDGRRIQVFRFTKPESNQILSVESATEGALWIGTRDGAFRFADREFKQLPGTDGKAITAVTPDGDDLYGAASDGSILHFRVGNDGSYGYEEIYRLEIDQDTQDPPVIKALARLGPRLLIGTDGRGIVPLDISSRSPKEDPFGPPGINSLIPDGRSFLIGSNARRNDSGLYFLDDDGRPQLISAPTGSVLSIAPDGLNGGIWVGSRTNGLLNFIGPELAEQYTFENTLGNLRSNIVHDVFIDREGVVWAGTDRGVSRFDPASPFHQTLADDPNSNFVRCLYRASDGKIFAGTNLGLFVFDGSRWTSLPQFSEYAVYSLLQEGSGDLLVATSDGLADQEGTILLDGDMRSILKFGSKYYAIAFGTGLIEISDEGVEVKVRETGATALVVNGKRLLLGTAGNGLFGFDGDKAELLVSAESLKGGAVWDVSADRNGALWIGAESGLFVYGNGKTEQVSKDQGVRDVLVIDDDVWAATAGAGLLHVRRDELAGWLRSHINVEKGMPSDKTFAVLEDRKSIVTGTNRGVVTYRPDRNEPKISLIRALSQRLHSLKELTSGINLEYPQNSILIEVAGQSSRTFPEEFQYAFILKDGDGKVLENQISGEPQYAPPGLEPGDYTIESRVFDRDLQSSLPLIATFTVGREPFPWTATALGVLLALSLAALIWAVIEHRRMRARNRELAVARQDLVNEAERERRRIARDLHDQTLADLRTLMMKGDRLSKGETWLRDEIEAVSTEIRRICEDLSPSVLENVGLVASLEFLLGQTFKNHSFRASRDADEKIDLPINFQLQIYRIAQEVLTNIDRHSNADLVEMKVDASDPDKFRLSIRDNGTPFRPEDSNSIGRGIANIRSRANIISAKILWENPGEGGNIFTLDIEGAKEG